MSTPRKASVRRSGRAGTELTPGMLKVLITGEHLKFNDPVSDPASEFLGLLPEQDATIRAIWQIAGDDITRDYIRDNPGKRPGAWWIFEESVQLFRRKVGGDIKVDVLRPGEIQVNSLLAGNRFGVPRFRAANPKVPVVFESQAQFLKRTKRLTPDEAARLQPGDYRPEVVRPADVA